MLAKGSTAIVGTAFSPMRSAGGVTFPRSLHRLEFRDQFLGRWHVGHPEASSEIGQPHARAPPIYLSSHNLHSAGTSVFRMA